MTSLQLQHPWRRRQAADAIILVVPFFFAIEQRTKGMCGHESKQIFRAVNKAALFSTSVYG